MPKNIVVLSDGTGQEGGRGHDSNVYKLYRMLEDRTDNQVVFYDEGLGTDWRKVTGSAFGVGFSRNLLECYRFIFENYNAGDKIFLLGFSRGAATVRSLANFIHYFGILPRSRPKLINEAYKLYSNRRQPLVTDEEIFEDEEEADGGKQQRGRGMRAVNTASYKVYSALQKDLDKESKQFILAHPNQWVSIEFLGVWDTVPALGFVPMAGLDILIDKIPWLKHSFHDFKLHPSVRNAYQALSIDDDRKWFHPSIWNQHDPDRQKVKQVWFSGSHTDVGGGFVEAGLSDIALEWMVQQAERHGILLYLNSKKYWNFGIAPDAVDEIHPPRKGAGAVYKHGSRADGVWDERALRVFGPPVIHESVFSRVMNSDYLPWILDNYPDPEKWLQGHLEKTMRRKFKTAFEPKYQEWYEKQWSIGVQDLPSFEVWAKNNPSYYKTWLKSNRVDAAKWLAENNLGIRSFRKKKYLIEIHPATKLIKKLRDYTAESRPKVLQKIEYDISAHEHLYERLNMNDRFTHERKRTVQSGHKKV